VAFLTAVKAMEAQQVVIERDAWFREAESAEKGQSIATAQAIVRATLNVGVDEQDRRNTWLQDAEMVRHFCLMNTNNHVCV
jgi:pre-mRNA-processing factor 6